jgi:chromosome segregation ATPase
VASNGCGKGGKKGREKATPQLQSEERKQLALAQKANDELRKQNKELLQKAGSDGGGDGEAADGTKEDGERVARLRTISKEIKSLRAIPSDLRGKYGLEASIQLLEAEKADIDKARREAKPADKRLEKSKAWEKKLQADMAAAEAEAVELAEKRRALDEEEAAHAARVGKLKAQLDEVQQEISSLLADLSREKSASGAKDTVKDTPAATAEAVRTFFTQLAPQVAVHPDGQARIGAIMQMLDELLQASRATCSLPAAQASTAPGEVASKQEDNKSSHLEHEVEMDDSFLDALAEAAYGEEGDATEGGVSRSEQVAAAKDRLKAKRGVLSKKLVLKSSSK